MIRVCHIITGTDTGGAEMMLSKLTGQHDRRKFEVEVISLLPIGAIGEKIAAQGITVRTAGMTRSIPSLSALQTVKAQIRAFRPHVVQTWMYHADLIGGLAAKQAGVRSIVWNIRNSTLDRQSTKRSTLAVVRLCARLSRRIPQKVVCCSQVAQALHQSIGYDKKRIQIIPNGFDLSQFRPDVNARVSVRAELGLAPDTPIIGLAARYHPQKDHATFVHAAKVLHRDEPDVHYVLCGKDIDAQNAELTGFIREAGLEANFHLLGRRSDMPRLTAAFDIAASSSSFGEAFPNVLGEAMACGVPCSATNVGDSGYIIGETGLCVPPDQPAALAEAWCILLNEAPAKKQERSDAARRRVQQYFNLPDIAQRYEALYLSLAGPETFEDLPAAAPLSVRR
jgi:glycosyltransferase involved in cell wall biosynthesis